MVWYVMDAGVGVDVDMITGSVFGANRRQMSIDRARYDRIRLGRFLGRLFEIL